MGLAKSSAIITTKASGGFGGLQMTGFKNFKLKDIPLMAQKTEF
jgi:hypothetical protein